MALDDLPIELLLIIMDYLDMYSLMAFKCVCNKFYSLIDSYHVLTKKSNNLLVTNQMSEKFRKRCKPLLSSYSSKLIINQNWIRGIYKRRRIYKSEHSLTDDLQLTQNNLLFSSGKYLYTYNRTKDGIVNEIRSITMRTREDYFTSIICCNDVLISGHCGGSIRLWRRMESKNEYYFKLLKVHSNVYNYAVNLDATSDCIAVPVSNGIQIHKYTYEEDVLGEGNKIFDDNSYVKSIKFDPTGTKIAWISTGKGCTDCLSIYDINNQSCQNKFLEEKTFPGKVLWEDPHTILTLDQMHVKKMDIRTSKFVRKWDAPRDALDIIDIFTCFSSDNLYTIITGTYYNEVILWDQRKIIPVQAYTVEEYSDARTLTDRIDSLVFDSSHLYIAVQNHIIGGGTFSTYEFDFKGNNFDPVKMNAVY